VAAGPGGGAAGAGDRGWAPEPGCLTSVCARVYADACGCRRRRLRTDACPGAGASGRGAAGYQRAGCPSRRLPLPAPEESVPGEPGAGDSSWEVPCPLDCLGRAPHPGDDTRRPGVQDRRGEGVGGYRAEPSAGSRPLRAASVRPGAGGLVASPPSPSSLWLDSWTPLVGKPERGVPCCCPGLGNLPLEKG
jgi:hypothetical protein